MPFGPSVSADGASLALSGSSFGGSVAVRTLASWRTPSSLSRRDRGVAYQQVRLALLVKTIELTYIFKMALVVAAMNEAGSVCCIDEALLFLVIVELVFAHTAEEVVSV